MKKYFLFIVVIFSLVSCEEDVRFNNPSLQGLKDNVFWRAVESKATLASDGSLLIEAYIKNEILSLKITSTQAQTYFLGTSESKKVTYVITDATGDTITFSTGFGIGDGQIVVTEYDDINKTISGTFKFNAENTYNNPLAGPLVNFQQGVFYKVPVSSLIQ
ncbi:DUF6252 family protein [Flavobacterium gawalongense]|uniref:Lipoprotein n=1 Tax=Flavobacterium gawalongense TaxID=2594432 RepID=A0A553BH42_9FLAO|nr:DUF6252 family protein [Flavobacterium gawalongense]TRX00611.1 hypothetical protein FNW33_11655 [Flavobacterium gawalongense]TRX04678.1 hypothetical protein FNW12_13295 [Flavobacterium gawalongense]TRX07552.1 hypothetical protein FNW11_12815 [Flavobacterium gawalongense]TRX12949.1 hypothetical protein FNW10_02670 [Flavobacterium gawalongense]TRX31083.1 hypothetical protein FNW38_02580 [Flavobacterium gawalongense]